MSKKTDFALLVFTIASCSYLSKVSTNKMHKNVLIWNALGMQLYLSGYRSGSQLSKIILNNTYTLRYVSYTYYFILGLGLGLILYYFAELAAGPIHFLIIIFELRYARYANAEQGGANVTMRHVYLVSRK